MKICVIGAGAIGGMLGAKLTLGGNDVTFVEKNAAHAKAIAADGLKIVAHDGSETVARGLTVVDEIAKAGKQDLVIVAVKAHQIPGISGELRGLFGPETTVMTVQNGIPFWYFYKLDGPYENRRIEAVDPTGELEKNIERDRIVGCVVYPAGEVIAPGVIKHVEGDRYSVGELDGSQSERVKKLSETLVAAGFKSFVLEDIRSEIWLKLWGNLSFNPISALTHGTLAGMARYEPAKELVANMMREAQEIAGKLGITFRHTIEKRIAGAESVGEHKTSMLQDVEAGRALEVEALVGAVVELGRLTETPTPHINAVYACTKLLDKVMTDGNVAFPPVPKGGAAAERELAAARS
ncbi:MAG: 2-dehydropantoate 2-reductase [Candidatus Eremiobacteraeota bacterium]|nr:2-dehydropantoate 2-reductase [Candidatus Eremiobacteraeota bacterium]